MRLRLIALVAVLVAILASTAHGAGEPLGVTVSVSRDTVDTALGTTFRFTTRIDNTSGTATPALVAHLNVLSYDSGTYVDPEDWSSGRTRYLESLPAGGSKTIEWAVKAVNSGSIGVYVAVLPRSGTGVAPVTGPLLRAEIAGRRTLDAGGILPLALGIPAFLTLLALGLRVRRRRA